MGATNRALEPEVSWERGQPAQTHGPSTEKGP